MRGRESEQEREPGFLRKATFPGHRNTVGGGDRGWGAELGGSEVSETDPRGLGKRAAWGQIKGMNSRTEGLAELRNQKFIENPICVLC